MRRIAVLTSGDGAPGMNAVIRAVVRSADATGVEAFGVADGYAGLVAGRITRLDARGVSGILHRPGTVLGTGEAKTLRTTEGRRRALTQLDLHAVDGLVVAGGGGSLRGAWGLAAQSGVRLVGVPCTIHNDLSGTDFSIGFDTTANRAIASLDVVRDLPAGGQRLVYVQLPRRLTRWVALYAGLATGATAVVADGPPADVAALRRQIRRSLDLGKQRCLVLVASPHDGADEVDQDATLQAEQLADAVAQDLDAEYRVTRIDLTPEVEAPTLRDRVLGSLLGDAAVGALLTGAAGVMVGQRHGEVVHTPLDRTWGHANRTTEELVALLQRLAR